MAEFIYELYINEDSQCNQLIGSHKNLIIAFLLKINQKIEQIELDKVYLIGHETKLYLYRLVKILTGLFSPLKQVANLSSITDKQVIEFIRFVGLIVDRITYLNGFFDRKTFSSFGKYIKKLEVYDIESEYYHHKDTLISDFEKKTTKMLADNSQMK
jgi:hypothetical protein